MIELSSFSRCEVMEVKEDASLRAKKASKKVKGDSPISVSSASLERTVKKKSHLPFRKHKSRVARFNKFKQEHPSFFKMAERSRSQEPHYSTEEETPSVILEEDPQIQHIIFQGREDARIYFPIWRTYHSVQALAKLAELKMNDSISLPFSPPAKKFVKTRENKRVLISTSSNPLHLNEAGELVEKER